MQNEEKKILANPPRSEKTFRGCYRRLIWFSWWKYFSWLLINYLRFSHFSIFWEILEDFSDFFRKFSIVSENYRIRNLIFKEKRRNFIFLTNSEKSLPISTDILYFLRTRWDWETKNSRKIAETLDLKNSEKNSYFLWRTSILFKSSGTEIMKIFRKSKKLHVWKILKKISFSLNNSYFLRPRRFWKNQRNFKTRKCW